MATTEETVTMTTPEDEVRQFIQGHVWLAVLVTLAAFAIAVIASYCICRLRKRSSRRRQHEYQNLDEDWTLTSKVELQKRRVKVAQRDTALLNCSFFLRSSGEYTLLDHLPELGCRDSKQWFLVRHKETGEECVLTVFPKPAQMAVPFSTGSVRTMCQLLVSLQHPYLQPVRELSFQMDVEHVVSISPYNRAGSLRDHIYTARCIDGWAVKYGDKGEALELPTVRLYGKQILQALLFLKERGFPFFGHLHSGNVLVVDNTCRLCGYDDTLLSVPPKLKQLLKRYAKTDMRHFDVICFGHLLYQMVTGFELDTVIPESRHYVLVHKPQVVEILQYIFNTQASEYPTIKKISQHVFFKHVKLKELDTYSALQILQPPSIKSLLKSIKKAHPVKRRASAAIVGDTRPRSASQASLSSHSSMASSLASGSRAQKPSQQIVPLTPVLSDTEKTQQLPFTSAGGKGSRSQEETEITTERSALLGDIRKGFSLKRTHPQV